jgi:electron transfer flavoprotein alpha/beta subunit
MGDEEITRTPFTADGVYSIQWNYPIIVSVLWQINQPSPA